MKCTPVQKLYLAIAAVLLVLHVMLAALVKPSFALTMSGDAFPTALILLALLSVRQNMRHSAGILRIFWKVFGGGLLVLLVSQAFWFYFDWRRLTGQPSPVPGDTLFLVSNVFFLSALALRPHSASAGRDLRIRSLDFVVLSVWWLCLFGYYAWPWHLLLGDLSRYNPPLYTLTFVQHLVIVTSLVLLSFRRTGAWRSFYLQMTAAFVFIGVGSLLLDVAINDSYYYAGSFYDTLFLAGLFFLLCLTCFGASLQPKEDAVPDRELVQSVWTARIAMLVMLSLPVIALTGLRARDIPQVVAVFRLRFIFASMFVLGALVYWKLHLLTRQLVWLVRLTGNSIENLEAVQQQVSLSEKYVALGRLASGAAHEISNPLTAILGYSELLADIPSLSAEDRAQAGQIRDQVHRAQAAVASLRGTIRVSPPPPSLVIDKEIDS